MPSRATRTIELGSMDFNVQDSHTHFKEARELTSILLDQPVERDVCIAHSVHVSCLHPLCKLLY